MADIVLLVIFIIIMAAISRAAVKDYRLAEDARKENGHKPGECNSCSEDSCRMRKSVLLMQEPEEYIPLYVGDLINCRTECEMLTAMAVYRDMGILVRRADPDDGEYNLIVLGHLINRRGE